MAQSREFPGGIHGTVLEGERQGRDFKIQRLPRDDRRPGVLEVLPTFSALHASSIPSTLTTLFSIPLKDRTPHEMLWITGSGRMGKDI
jgi:hypothetical protein